MKKPRFSHLRKILKKKSNNETNQRTNVTSTIQEETEDQYAQEPVADD